MLKTNVLNAYFQRSMKIKINSDDDLPLEKILNMCNSKILIKSVSNKNHNHYYYQTVLEKCPYK